MSLPAVKPRKNNIAVDPIFERDTYESNVIELIKPDQYKGRCTQGIVKYIGEGVPDDIQKGDYVFFSAYTGSLWALGDELLIFMGHSKILARRDMLEDDRKVSGLYFKGVTDWEKIRTELSWHLQKNIGFGLEALDSSEIIKMCQPQYWPADYSQVIKLVANSIDDALTLKERNPQNQENFLIEEGE